MSTRRKFWPSTFRDSPANTRGFLFLSLEVQIGRYRSRIWWMVAFGFSK
jgi:hypothetical protein